MQFGSKNCSNPETSNETQLTLINDAPLPLSAYMTYSGTTLNDVAITHSVENDKDQDF